MAAFYGKKTTEHAFQTFSADLKKDQFPPVLFLYGCEDYLIDWAVDSLVKRYVNAGAMSLDYIKLNEDGVTADQVLTACDTFSMFSEKRVIWVKEFPPLRSASAKGFTAKDTELLTAYVQSPNEGTLLIFSAEAPEDKSPLVKALKKACKCYNFCKLEYAQLAGFAEKRFRMAGAEIDRDTMRYLIDETGYFNKETEYRISNLNNDIRKIIAHSGGQRVTEEDISQTLHGDLDTFVFNFLDGVSNRNKDAAFQLLHNILASGSDVFSIVGLLVNHFELILEVKEFKEDGMGLSQITGVLKLHEFRIKKAMAFADKFTVEKLKSILSQLYEVDRNIKTGLLDQTLALELLVGRL